MRYVMGVATRTHVRMKVHVNLAILLRSIQGRDWPITVWIQPDKMLTGQLVRGKYYDHVTLHFSLRMAGVR